MFKNNQILYMRFQCTDVYGCPKLLDMSFSLDRVPFVSDAFVGVKETVASSHWLFL